MTVRAVVFLLPFAICHLPCRPAFAADVRNELPAPSNTQVVVLKNAISFSWQWQPPEMLPSFQEFGYEVKRNDGKTFIATGTSYADADLSPGTYSYIVRARGTLLEKKKQVIYVSDWSEPVGGDIKMSCQRPPTIEMTAAPTQKEIDYMSTLRFHIQGQASVDKGCTLQEVTYHLDTGAGVVHTGPLKVDAKGHFDTFVNAYGPEDELPKERESFSITAKAVDEAGPTISSVYSLDLGTRNPYAPDKPYNPF